ncbi:MAG: hypothetical protein ACOYU3_09725 [Bacillota bacterium]
MEASEGMTRKSVRKGFRILARRWYWPVIFCVVFAFASLSLFFLKLYTPEYKISTTFIPATYQTDRDGNAISGGLDDAVARSVTYAPLVKNEQVRDAIRSAVDFKITKEEYDEAITAAYNEYSAAVTISVTWKDEAQAYQLLETVKGYLTYVVSHSANAGAITWLDGYSSEFEQKGTRPSLIFALGAFIGLCAGACFALLLGVADKRVFDLKEVRYGGEVDVLGVIGKDRVFKGKSYANRNALNHSHKQLMAIAFHIRKQMEAHGKKLIMCISPTAKCGTSKVVNEIARLLSNIQMRILIITIKKKASPDAPAEEPVITSLIPRVDGCACFWEDSENNSAFIGPISRTISSAMEKYDLILVDCPPLLENIEMALFAGGMDATLLVFKYGKTEHEDVLSSVAMLSRAEAGPLWCVWNFADKRYVRKPYIHQ